MNRGEKSEDEQGYTVTGRTVAEDQKINGKHNQKGIPSQRANCGAKSEDALLVGFCEVVSANRYGMHVCLVF